MTIGVLYGAWVARPYLKRSITNIMSDGADQVGLILLITGAGGIGLSLPNDSGFWAISRFFHISVTDTLRGWSLGGFVAGVTILAFTMFLSLFQNALPGLMQ